MGCTLRLLRPGFTLTFSIQQHMHVAESTMSRGSSETRICPNVGTKVFYYQYICASISQWGAPVRSETTHALFPVRTKNLWRRCIHLWLKPSTAESAKEVEWGVCVSSFQRALYPGSCQLVVLRDLCTTKLADPLPFKQESSTGGGAPCSSAAGVQRKLGPPSADLCLMNIIKHTVFAWANM